MCLGARAIVAAVFAAAAIGAGRDQGRSRPPAALTESYKALWMGEWAACRHQSLHRLANELHLKVPANRTPQQTARVVASVAEAPLWNIQEEIDAAVDGCRNGILWRFYHE